MKIAFFTYPAAFQNIGGGEVLLLKTKEYLEKGGHTVCLFDTWRDRIEDYDWLHLFCSVKDCLGLVQVANARKVKVAITPLIWSDWRMALYAPDSLKTKSELLIRHWTKVFFPSFPSARRKLLMCSDLIFPNSELEKRHLARLFALPDEKMRVVYNGVDPSFLHANPDWFQKNHPGKPFVLSVGRIEPRKNQLNLIRAVKNISSHRLVLIGSPVSGYEDYFKQCRKEGGSFTTFIPTLSHGDPLLKSAYAACDVFVLQGWFETPGLVAMEAALAGAKVVATIGGSTREYFKDDVQYCNPASPSHMHNQIISALGRRQTNDLRDHVLANFTWDKIAQATVRFYNEFSE